MSTRHHFCRELGDRPVVFVLSTNQVDYNLYNAYVAQYGVPGAAVNVTLFITSGVVLTPSAGGPALTIGAFPSGSVAGLGNAGTIVGWRGLGGAGATDEIDSGDNGTDGGDAIDTDTDLYISNLYGNIWAGGGGGGGGGGKRTGILAAPGGDGGRGAGADAGGWGGGEPGSEGGTNTFGERGASGGGGGDYGSAGSWGSNSTPTGAGGGFGGFSGAGGAAVRKNGKTVVFVDGDNASQVKGAVV